MATNDRAFSEIPDGTLVTIDGVPHLKIGHGRVIGVTSGQVVNVTPGTTFDDTVRTPAIVPAPQSHAVRSRRGRGRFDEPIFGEWMTPLGDDGLSERAAGR